MGYLLEGSETVAIVRATRFERQRIQPPAWDHDMNSGQTATERWADYSEGNLVGRFEFETLLSLKGAPPPAVILESDLERRLFIAVTSEGWDGLDRGAHGPCFFRAVFSFGRLYAMGFNGDGKIVGAMSFGDEWPQERIAELAAQAEQ